MSTDENQSLVCRYFDEQWNHKNVAPTGHRITFQDLSLLRVEDGKIISNDGFSDLLESSRRFPNRAEGSSLWTNRRIGFGDDGDYRACST